MQLATWNVNSVRTRVRHVARFLEDRHPDLLLLQELKCEAESFPALEFRALGYHAEIVGQKGYNGVAVLSREPVTVRHRRLPRLREGAEEARYLEIAAGEITVINIYAPNGNSGGAAGFAAKLAFLAQLARRAEALLGEDVPLAIGGDFNVAPEPVDVAEGALPPTDALVRPESRAAFRSLLWLGLACAVRTLQPRGPAYTFWDYQANAFDRDLGLRIDHVLLSPTLAERLRAVEICRAERAAEQPSDHVPVMVTLD
ncbi:MAG TPA: exodeoxyribonuclease III [Acetobacteraceae bacterium]|nr:exodeoxyribonuclease III [Acetobacteraceae bacterium]